MIKVYGADICVNCRELKAKLNELSIPYEFIDITASTDNLKSFLKLRDNEPIYDQIKAEGRIGTPTVIDENGEIILDYITRLG